MVVLIILLTLYSLRRLWVVWAEILNFDGVGWSSSIETFLFSAVKSVRVSDDSQNPSIFDKSRNQHFTFRQIAREVGTLLFSGSFTSYKSEDGDAGKGKEREEITTTMKWLTLVLSITSRLQRQRIS